MRRAPLFLIACVVLLAGCSSAVDTGSVETRGGVPEGYPMDRDVATPVVITTLAPDPIPVTATDGKVHVVYELQVFNVAPRPVAITKVETLVGGPDGAVVATMGRDEVAARALEYPSSSVPGSEGAPVTEIAPGRTVVLLLDDVYASRSDVPSEATHRISITLGAATPGSEAAGAWYPDTMALIGGGVRTSSSSPVVLGPPVAGEGWLVNNGCCGMSPHRGATVSLGARMNGGERYAVDLMQLASETSFFTGDGTRNEDYPGYGAALLAVADGTVVAVVSDKPDEPPGSIPEGIEFDQILGNHVLLDIGGGNYAIYAHMTPGSATVKAGDKVTRGQAIGTLGNSGNTTAPHLHFHVSRAPLPLAGDNVPYVIDGFTHAGSFSTLSFVQGPDDGPRANQMPLEGDVLDFPPLPK